MEFKPEDMKIGAWYLLKVNFHGGVQFPYRKLLHIYDYPWSNHMTARTLAYDCSSHEIDKYENDKCCYDLKDYIKEVSEIEVIDHITMLTLGGAKFVQSGRRVLVT